MNENNWIFSWPILILITIFACGTIWGIFVQESSFWPVVMGGFGLVVTALELLWEYSSRKKK